MKVKLDKSQFAIPPGMPYQEFYRRADSAHKALMSGDASQATQLFPASVVADLDRLRTRVDPRVKSTVHVDHRELEQRRRSSNLRDWWPDVVTKFQVTGHRRVLVALDGDGIVLARAGDSKFMRWVGEFGLSDGADWRCAESGTNGVRISHLLKKPFQIAGPAHFSQDQHKAGCAVSPVFDRDGRVVGFLDLVCPSWEVSPEMLLLVTQAAADLGTKIDICYRVHLARLRQRARRELDLARYADGALVIDKNGWVALSHQIEQDDRLRPPVGGFHAGPAEVEGLGRVFLEPLLEGWLVRRAKADGSTGIRATLDLRIPSYDPSHVGWIQIEGRTVSWRESLNLSKAEVLLTLATLGPRTRPELEADLYLKPEDVADSTLRSRLNRLRELFDSLLTIENKRDMFDRNIIADVRCPADRTQLLPCSVAPAIRRLAQS
jgi:hypothetical protein